MATICLHLPKQGSANKQTHHTELSSNDIAQLGDKQTNHTKLSSNDIVPIIFHTIWYILLQVREYVACSFTYLPRLRSASKTYRTLIQCYWKAWSTMKYIEQAFNSKILDMHRPKVWLLCTHTNIVILA